MKPASIWDWLGPFALMAVFIAFLFLTTPSEIVLCRGSDDCFREWIGALSGWAAAIAAAATIIILVRQLHTQQRQTDFQLGDALPTFDVVLHEGMPDSPHITATNWNRRIAAIRTVEVVSPKAALVINGWFGGGAIFQGSVAFINPAWTFEGWIDRTKSPPQYGGILAVAPAGPLPIIPWETTRVRFTYTLAGLPGEFVSEAPVYRAKLVIQAAGTMAMVGFNSGV